MSSIEISNGRHPKLSSIQSTDTVSPQTLSDPSEEAGGALPTYVSMQSRPGSKVGPRVLSAGQSGLAPLYRLACKKSPFGRPCLLRAVKLLS